MFLGMVISGPSLLKPNHLVLNHVLRIHVSKLTDMQAILAGILVTSVSLIYRHHWVSPVKEHFRDTTCVSVEVLILIDRIVNWLFIVLRLSLHVLNERFF